MTQVFVYFWERETPGRVRSMELLERFTSPRGSVVCRVQSGAEVYGFDAADVFATEAEARAGAPERKAYYDRLAHEDTL